MSIKGIDTQMMVTRSSNFMPEADMTRRAGEMQQSTIAEQNKTKDVHDSQSVVKAELHSGEDADGTGEYHEKRRKHDEDDELESAHDLPPVRSTGRTIDISI